jgi:hypothetical protein
MLAADEEPIGGVYKGSTLQGLRHGRGKYVYANPFFTYEGDWRKGLKHGKGKFSLGDGSVYEGEFAFGEIDGWGTRTWPSGASYSGQFHQGEMHGTGTRIDSDGSQYEGHFVENTRHGRGKLMAADGSVYDGAFERNRQTGEGSLIAGDGAVYEGTFDDGSRHGTGTEHRADGSSYTGEWESSLFHGHGTYTAAERVYRGEWERGRPLGLASTLGLGSVILPLVEGAPASEATEGDEDPPPTKPAKAAKGSKRSATPSSAHGSTAEEKPSVGLILGSPYPTVVIKCIDPSGAPVLTESGRLIRATLCRFAVPEVAPKEKSKKGKAELASATVDAPEMVCKHVIGEALTVDGLATFSEWMIPEEVTPSTNDKEYEISFHDETDVSDAVLPSERLETLRLACTMQQAAATD